MFHNVHRQSVDKKERVDFGHHLQVKKDRHKIHHNERLGSHHQNDLYFFESIEIQRGTL